MDSKEETTASAVSLPHWAGDCDISTGNDDWDWTRRIRCTGGASVADNPTGSTIDVILDRFDYLMKDGTEQTNVTLHINSDDEGYIPLEYAFRTAAAILAMLRAYDLNTPEPTERQVDDIEARLADLLDAKAVTA